MDTLYTFRENITHRKAKSVHVLGLMNSATKLQARLELGVSGPVGLVTCGKFSKFGCRSILGK